MSGSTTASSLGSIGPNGASVLSSYNASELSKFGAPVQAPSFWSSAQRTNEATSLVSFSSYGSSRYMGSNKPIQNGTQRVSTFAPRSLASKTTSAAAPFLPLNGSKPLNLKQYSAADQGTIKPMDGASGSIEVGGKVEWGGKGGAQGSAYVKGQVNDGKGTSAQGQITQNSNGQGNMTVSVKKDKPK